MKITQLRKSKHAEERMEERFGPHSREMVAFVLEHGTKGRNKKGGFMYTLRGWKALQQFASAARLLGFRIPNGKSPFLVVSEKSELVTVGWR